MRLRDIVTVHIVLPPTRTPASNMLEPPQSAYINQSFHPVAPPLLIVDIFNISPRSPQKMLFAGTVASVLDTVSDIIDPQYGGRPRHRPKRCKYGGKSCRGCPGCRPSGCTSGLPCYGCPMCLPCPPMCPLQFNQPCHGCPTCTPHFPSMGYSSNLPLPPPSPPMCPRQFNQPCYGCPICAPHPPTIEYPQSPVMLPQLPWNPATGSRPASIASRDVNWNGVPSIHSSSTGSSRPPPRGRSTSSRPDESQSLRRGSPLQPLEEDSSADEVHEAAKPIGQYINSKMTSLSDVYFLGTLGLHIKAQWTFEIPENWRCSVRTVRTVIGS